MFFTKAVINELVEVVGKIQENATNLLEIVQTDIQHMGIALKRINELEERVAKLERERK